VQADPKARIPTMDAFVDHLRKIPSEFQQN
jgi:hypothetical protein